MNIPSECRIASIGRDHAMILPHDANPKPDGIFGKDRWAGAEESDRELDRGAVGRLWPPPRESHSALCVPKIRILQYW
jgi:hypothetical protein